MTETGSNTRRATVDDGPPTFFKSLSQYKYETKRWITKIQEELGWKVVQYILSDGAMDPDEDYTLDYREISPISYGKVKKYKSHLRDIIENLGWSVINWMGTEKNNLCAGPPVAGGVSKDNVRNTINREKEALQKFKNGQVKLHSEQYSSDWWKKQILMEENM